MVESSGRDGDGAAGTSPTDALGLPKDEGVVIKLYLRRLYFEPKPGGMVAEYYLDTGVARFTRPLQGLGEGETRLWAGHYDPPVGTQIDEFPVSEDDPSLVWVNGQMFLWRDWNVLQGQVQVRPEVPVVSRPDLIGPDGADH